MDAYACVWVRDGSLLAQPGTHVCLSVNLSKSVEEIDTNEKEIGNYEVWYFIEKQISWKW